VAHQQRTTCVSHHGAYSEVEQLGPSAVDRTASVSLKRQTTVITHREVYGQLDRSTQKHNQSRSNCVSETKHLVMLAASWELQNEEIGP
jgi:hypothetical protein